MYKNKKNKAETKFIRAIYDNIVNIVQMDGIDTEEKVWINFVRQLPPPKGGGL
jgi:hypothetical protein